MARLESKRCLQSLLCCEQRTSEDSFSDPASKQHRGPDLSYGRETISKCQRGPQAIEPIVELKIMELRTRPLELQTREIVRTGALNHWAAAAASRLATVTATNNEAAGARIFKDKSERP